MASKILKGLAVAAGTGLAIGFGSKRRAQAASVSESSENTRSIEPLLDRVDRIEARVSAVEARPDTEDGDASGPDGPVAGLPAETPNSSAMVWLLPRETGGEMKFDLNKIDSRIRKLEEIRRLASDPEALALMEGFFVPNGTDAVQQNGTDAAQQNGTDAGQQKANENSGDRPVSAPPPMKSIAELWKP